MAIQRVAPDTLAVQTGLTGAVTAIQDDPDSFDANWLTTTATSGTNSDLRVTFSALSPVGQLNIGAGLQEFRVLLRKNASGDRSTQVSIQLYENDVLLATLASGVTVTSLTGAVTSVTWNASLLTDPTGAGVECRVQQTAGGANGSVSGRRWIEVGAVEWNADYSVVAVGFTTTASLGAELYKTRTSTSSYDALLHRSGVAATTSLDGVLGFNVREKTASLDAVLEDTLYNTITTRPVPVQDDGSEVLVTEDSSDHIVSDESEPIGPGLEAALLREGDTVTSSLDGLLVFPRTTTASLDAGLFRSGDTVVTSLDGALARGVGLDGFLQTGTTHFTINVSDLFDALLVRTGLTKTTSFTAALDATATNTLTLSLDARLQEDAEQSIVQPVVDLDAILGARDFQPAVDLDAYLFKWTGAGPSAQVWNTPAAARNPWIAKAAATAGFWDASGTGAEPSQPGDIVRTGQPTLALGAALIREDIPLITDLDAHVAFVQRRTADFDAQLTGSTRFTTVPMDGWLYASQSRAASFDGTITGKATFTKSLGLDATLASGVPTFQVLGLNAVLHPAPVARLDGTLVKNFGSTTAVVTTNPMDAWLSKTVTKSAQLHAAPFRKQWLKTTSLNGVLVTASTATGVVTASLDSELRYTWLGDVNFDGLLTANATLTTKTLSIAALLNATEVKTAGMNAVLVASPAFSSDFSSAFDTSF
jgi:hypothetical protein